MRISTKIFVASLSLGALLCAWLCSPVYGVLYGDLYRALQAGLSRPPVVLLGDSVIRTVSKCDLDKSTIAELLQKEIGQPVFDASRGGMGLEEALHLGGIVTTLGSKQLIVPITVSGGFLHARRAKLGTDAWLKDNLSFGAQLSEVRPLPVERASDYARYLPPRENQLASAREKQAKRCPEGDGHDSAFVEYMHWRAFAWDELLANLPETIGALRGLERRAARLLVFVEPYNEAAVARILGAEAASRIARAVDNGVAGLRAAGFVVGDFSRSVPEELFIDRWCACGHLGEQGRKVVARGLRELLETDARVATRAREREAPVP